MTAHAQQGFYWLLDVRNIWSGNKIDDAAQHALSLVNTEEATKARGYHFLKDAKLSLGSSLLKRLFASTAASHRVKWADARFGRTGNHKHGKPCLVSEDLNGDPNEQSESDFNISHQAGLVALAGYSDTSIGSENGHSSVDEVSANGNDTIKTRVTSVGVDIVCVNERNDSRSLARHGLEGWVDMHSEIFSDADLRAMKAPVPGFSSQDSDIVVDAKMRRFYAYWALKEAYVKMEGEALLAGWLRDVEFRNVKVPDAASASNRGNSPSLEHNGVTVNGAGSDVWGETSRGIEVYLKGARRDGVELFLQAFQDNYMIATAVLKDDPTKDVVVPSWKILDPDKDIYPFAS